MYCLCIERFYVDDLISSICSMIATWLNHFDLNTMDWIWRRGCMPPPAPLREPSTNSRTSAIMCFPLVTSSTCCSLSSYREALNDFNTPTIHSCIICHIPLSLTSHNTIYVFHSFITWYWAVRLGYYRSTIFGYRDIIFVSSHNWTVSSLQYSTDFEGCVSNNFFRHSLDDSHTSHLTQKSGPSSNTAELIVIHNHPCKHSSKLQLSIRFTPSRCLEVQQDWYQMYYPEGMKARVSPLQSIEPHRILAPIRDSNKERLDPQYEVVTTILTLSFIICMNIRFNSIISVLFNILCNSIFAWIFHLTQYSCIKHNGLLCNSIFTQRVPYCNPKLLEPLADGLSPTSPRSPFISNNIIIMLIPSNLVPCLNKDVNKDHLKKIAPTKWVNLLCNSLCESNCK